MHEPAPEIVLAPEIVELSAELVELPPELVELDATVPFEVFIPGVKVWLYALDPSSKFGLDWFRIRKAGKFCHANRVWSTGHELIYGAKRLHAQDWGTPTSNQIGIGKRPSNCRKIIC